MKRFWPYLIIVVLFMSISVDVEAQCAMCRAQAESNAQSENSIVGALNSGILYLMAAPYILLFFLFRKKIVKFFKELSTMYRG